MKNEHRRFANGAVDQVGATLIRLFEYCHVDLDGTRSLYGERSCNRSVERLASDDENLADAKNRTCGANGMLELFPIHG
jgi:hypothetical protein